MPAIAGSIESVTLDGRSFAVVADADVNRKLGGFENNVLSNGDGTARLEKTRVAWSLSGVVVEIDDTQGDHEFLQNLQDSNRFFPATITYVSGVTYQGEGQLTGETAFSNMTSAAPINLMGTGKLTPQ